MPRKKASVGVKTKPLLASLDQKVVDRLLKKVEIDEKSECWVFQGATARGFGQLSVSGGLFYTHRITWTWFSKQDIPAGYEVDHLCHNHAAALGTCAGGAECLHRRCVNPSHLEPVSHSTNLNRSVLNPSTINSNKTHCKRGHELAGSNLLPYPLKKGYRECRQCSVTVWRKQA